MNTQLYIPDRLKVGFQPRTDTYTGKLAYVTYFKKNVLQKEKSWTGWIYQHVTDEEYLNRKQKIFDAEIDRQMSYLNRDGCDTLYSRINGESIKASGIPKTREGIIEYLIGSFEDFTPHPSYMGQISNDPSIVPVEFDNKPMSGFVLNKGVGGQRQSYGWNARNEYIRIYDPRNFEFEISVANLLFILRECNCSKGKGLDGEFVYAWEGANLILLPTTCEEYQNSVEFTGLKSKKVAAKDLIIGATYETKDQQKVVYLGQFSQYKYNTWRTNSYYGKPCNINKVYVYHYVDPKTATEQILSYTSMDQIARLIDPTPVANYAELVDFLNTQDGFGPITSFKLSDSLIIEKIFRHYDLRSLRKNDEGYIAKEMVYRKISENSFAEYVVVLIKGQEVKNSYRYDYKTEFTKCMLNQTRIITFNDNGTVDIKNKVIKSEVERKIDELQDLGLSVLNIQAKNYGDKLFLATKL